MQGFPDTKAALAGLLAVLAVAATACGERDEPELSGAPERVTSPTTNTVTAEPTGQPPGNKPDPPPPGKTSGPAEGPGSDPRVTELERAAERAVRDFVEALERRDGEAACALLAPGALERLELPKPRGGCAPSLRASIGYRDPRGLPVWEGAEISRVQSVQIRGREARVVVTVVTRFADRQEPSIEDDIVYLTRSDATWTIAKPSSTLYRAVGIADVPPSVISPP